MVTQFIQGLYIKQTPGILTVFIHGTTCSYNGPVCTIINSKWHNTNNCIHGITIIKQGH